MGPTVTKIGCRHEDTVEIMKTCCLQHYLDWSSKIIFNTLSPRQNGRQFPDDIFKSIFLTENVIISITISLKFVLKGLIDNIPTLDQIMAWRRPGDKPLSEPMMVSLLTQICVTRPQWVDIKDGAFTQMVYLYHFIYIYIHTHTFMNWKNTIRTNAIEMINLVARVGICRKVRKAFLS